MRASDMEKPERADFFGLYKVMYGMATVMTLTLILRWIIVKRS